MKARPVPTPEALKFASFDRLKMIIGHSGQEEACERQRNNRSQNGGKASHKISPQYSKLNRSITDGGNKDYKMAGALNDTSAFAQTSVQASRVEVASTDLPCASRPVKPNSDQPLF